MKVSRTILAVMAVAMMLIVPLTAVQADADNAVSEKKESGCYVENMMDIDDLDEFNTADRGYFLKGFQLGSDNLSCLGSFDYYSDNINVSEAKLLEVDLSEYEYAMYNYDNGSEYGLGMCYVIKGNVSYDLKMLNDGNLFNENYAEGELLKKANELFGTIEKDDGPRVSTYMTVKIVITITEKYKEAKDRNVVTDLASVTYIESSSSSFIQCNGNSVNISCDYKTEKDITGAYTFDKEISKDENAPAKAKTLSAATKSICNDAVLKGTVSSSDYTCNLAKTMKEKCAKESEDGTYTKSDCDTSSTIGYKDTSLAKMYDTSDDAAAEKLLNENGFYGVSDYSKAKSYIESILTHTKKTGESGAFIDNCGNITDVAKFNAIDKNQFVTGIKFGDQSMTGLAAYIYISDNVDLKSLTFKSVNLTDYNISMYNKTDDSEYLLGGCYVISGTISFTAKMAKAGKVFNETLSEGDLLKNANSVFGDVAAGKEITVTSKITVKLAMEMTNEYSDAKDVSVITGAEVKYVKDVSSISEIKYGDKTVNINCMYRMDTDTEGTYTFDPEISEELFAPSTAKKLSTKTTAVSSNCLLKGIVSGTEYSCDLAKTMSDTCRKTSEAGTTEQSNVSMSNVPELKEFTLASMLGTQDEESAKKLLSDNGFYGEVNYSAAKDNVDNQFVKETVNDYNDWAIAGVVVAIVLVLMLLFFVIKKE